MPDDSGQSIIEVATGVSPGQDLAFQISGTGTIPEPGAASDADGAPEESGTPAAAQGRPGGGLGNPEGTPDPLYKYRWAILGGLGVVLAIGGVLVVRRSGKPAVISESKASLPAGRERGAVLLDALKEELFQLEMDRQQGRLTPEQYASAKAALDQTLQRAAARLQPAGKA
jgi:hypothetical protein